MMVPILIDEILFPLVLISVGILAASRLLLRSFRFLHPVIEYLTRFRSFLGGAALVIGVLELVFVFFLPISSMRIGAAILSVITGCTLTIDVFISSRHSRRENLKIIWFGNLLLYIQDYTGVLAVFLGLIYTFVI